MQIQNPVNVVGGVNEIIEQAMTQLRADSQGYAQLFTWAGNTAILLGGTMDVSWTSLTTDYTGAGITPQLQLKALKIYIPPEATGRWTLGGEITANVAIGMTATFSVKDDAGNAVTEGRFPKAAPLQTIAGGAAIMASLPDVAKTRTDTGYTVTLVLKALAAATVTNVSLTMRKFL